MYSIAHPQCSKGEDITLRWFAKDSKYFNLTWMTSFYMNICLYISRR
jgi:hypothetical protein